MKPVTDQLKSQFESQLDLVFRISRIGLGFYEKSMEANASTVRKLLSLPVTESSNPAKLTESLVSGGKIAVSHVAASFVRGIEFQQQVLASLAPK